MRVGRKSLTGITITWEGSHVPHFPPPACFQTLSSFLQSVISETELARFNRIILKRISPPPPPLHSPQKQSNEDYGSMSVSEQRHAYLPLP